MLWKPRPAEGKEWSTSACMNGVQGWARLYRAVDIHEHPWTSDVLAGMRHFERAGNETPGEAVTTGNIADDRWMEKPYSKSSVQRKKESEEVIISFMINLEVDLRNLLILKLNFIASWIFLGLDFFKSFANLIYFLLCVVVDLWKRSRWNTRYTIKYQPILSFLGGWSTIQIQDLSRITKLGLDSNLPCLDAGN